MPPLPLTCALVQSPSRTDSGLSLNAAQQPLFRAGGALRLRLTATATGGAAGSAELQLLVNAPPSGTTLQPRAPRW